MAFADQMGFSFKPVDRRVWTVRELVAAVRTHIERDYGDTWVEGEISNFRAHDSGHLYFTLKDRSSQLSAVMFRSQARLLRFRPEDGMQVVARGRVTIYEDRGQLQISLEYLEPKGAGALQIAFEQLKAKLEAEGLFDAARKKAIPALPGRIGVVTSPQAAALRDILNILQRRHHSASVLIYPAQVQGETAAHEVRAGIRYFNQARNVDVIVVARGGGSAEDLAAFNDEALARAVAASEIPVISAVGHETDFTIIDFVADLRASTPSAAAEMVIRSRQEIEEQVAELAAAAGERAALSPAHGAAKPDGIGATWRFRPNDGTDPPAGNSGWTIWVTGWRMPSAMRSRVVDGGSRFCLARSGTTTLGAFWREWARNWMHGLP